MIERPQMTTFGGGPSSENRRSPIQHLAERPLGYVLSMPLLGSLSEPGAGGDRAMGLLRFYKCPLPTINIDEVEARSRNSSSGEAKAAPLCCGDQWPQRRRRRAITRCQEINLRPAVAPLGLAPTYGCSRHAI